MDPKAYKISVIIPPEYKDELMDAVNGSMQKMYPGYDRAFSVTAMTGHSQ